MKMLLKVHILNKFVCLLDPSRITNQAHKFTIGIVKKRNQKKCRIINFKQRQIMRRVKALVSESKVKAEEMDILK